VGVSAALRTDDRQLPGQFVDGRNVKPEWAFLDVPFPPGTPNCSASFFAFIWTGNSAAAQTMS